MSSRASAAAFPLLGKILVILRTSAPARLDIYERLAQCGARLVLVHPTPAPLFAGFFEATLPMETTEAAPLVEPLKALLSAAPFNRPDGRADAYISFDEFAVYPAAVLAETMGRRPVPLPSAAIRETSSKTAFRRWCEKHALPSPKWAALDNASQSPSAAVAKGGLTYPVVLKTSPGAGSIMASRCESAEALDVRAAEIWKTLETHPFTKHFENLGTPIQLILEEFIGGQEVDIEAVVENGDVKFAYVADNFETSPPFFCEVGGLAPSALDAEKTAALVDCLKKFVASHGTSLHGVLHFEAKYDFARGGPYIVEVNCRVGSAETLTMTLTTSGVHLGECLALLAISPNDTTTASLLPPLPPMTSGFSPALPGIGYCASVNILPYTNGILRCTRMPSLASGPAFVRASCLPVGWRVEAPPRGFSCVGWGVARGATAEEAKANIAQLTKEFVVYIDEDKE